MYLYTYKYVTPGPSGPAALCCPGEVQGTRSRALQGQLPFPPQGRKGKGSCLSPSPPVADEEGVDQLSLTHTFVYFFE